MAEYVVTLEPWSDVFWREAEPIARAHWAEVDEDVEPNRHFNVDAETMNALAIAGALKLITARRNGKLVGYYTWNISSDVESKGLLIAQQGAWYVSPGHPRVAFLMFRRAIEELRRLGVDCVYPHHRTQGRGADLGKFFKRQGAKEIQHTYSLWIAQGADDAQR